MAMTLLIFGVAIGLFVGLSIAAWMNDTAYRAGFDAARHLQIRQDLARAKAAGDWRHA